MKRKVLLFDDNPGWLERTKNDLKDMGIEVICVDSGLPEVISIIEANHDELAAVVIDLVMLIEKDPDLALAEGGDVTGHAAARHLRERYPNLPLIGASDYPEDYPKARDWFRKRGKFKRPVGVFKKGREDSLLFDLLCELTGAKREPKGVFLVHGHDHLTLNRVIKWVKRIDGLEPITIRDNASEGRTWIEQLEDLADQSFMAWVLLTPDDLVGSVGDASATEVRARQNVILELGYFLGKFGRKAGRVLLLVAPKVKLPSDLEGIRHIRLGDDFDAFLRELRREIGHFLPPETPSDVSNPPTLPDPPPEPNAEEPAEPG